MQQYSTRTSVVIRDGRTTSVGPRTPPSNAVNTLTRSLGLLNVATDEEATITNLARIDASVPDETVTAAPPTSKENTVYITDTTTIASPPFFKLPGELRNRIYHLYFEGFEEQMSRRVPYSKSKMSANLFALMHTNRVIRSEAGSVLYKEIASFNPITCPTDQPIDAVVLTRIRDVCSLSSKRDAHMNISIRCTPSWKDYGRTEYRGHDRWRSLEIKTFASRALVRVSQTARPPKLTMEEASQWLHGVHASWSSCASNHTHKPPPQQAFWSSTAMTECARVRISCTSKAHWRR